MKKLIFVFTICVCIGVLLSIFTMNIANSQTKQDKIQYNVVYDCPEFSDAKGTSGGRKFKVLRCDGTNCKVFMINEYNPKGGFELDMTKAHVLDDISRYRCVAPGGNNDTEEETEEQTPKEEQPTKNPAGKVACPASDADSNGKTALEKSFRGAIRETWEQEAEPGMDGAVTIAFQAFSIGKAHPYRVYEDPKEMIGKTIYPVRATFTTCTDYNRRIEMVKREREMSCYKNTAGKYACTIIAAANTNVKDKTTSIDKPAQ